MMLKLKIKMPLEILLMVHIEEDPKEVEEEVIQQEGQISKEMKSFKREEIQKMTKMKSTMDQEEEDPSEDQEEEDNKDIQLGNQMNRMVRMKMEINMKLGQEVAEDQEVETLEKEVDTPEEEIKGAEAISKTETPHHNTTRESTRLRNPQRRTLASLNRKSDSWTT
jgi:hypothetical protein